MIEFGIECKLAFVTIRNFNEDTIVLIKGLLIQNFLTSLIQSTTHICNFRRISTHNCIIMCIEFFKLIDPIFNAIDLIQNPSTITLINHLINRNEAKINFLIRRKQRIFMEDRFHGNFRMLIIHISFHSIAFLSVEIKAIFLHQILIIKEGNIPILNQSARVHFMAFDTHGRSAEELRVYLLEKYQVGAINIMGRTLRLAFCSVEEDKIPDLVDTVYKAAGEILN